MQIETVKVVSDVPEHGGFIIINKSDFNEEIHELFEEDADKKLTVKEMKALLDEANVEYPKTAKADDLRELVNKLSPKE